MQHLLGSGEAQGDDDWKPRPPVGRSRFSTSIRDALIGGPLNGSDTRHARHPDLDGRPHVRPQADGLHDAVLARVDASQRAGERLCPQRPPLRSSSGLTWRTGEAGASGRIVDLVRRGDAGISQAGRIAISNEPRKDVGPSQCGCRFLPSCACCARSLSAEKIDDVLRRACFAQPREDPGKAVQVGIGAEVGHGVAGECDVEAEFVSLSRR